MSLLEILVLSVIFIHLVIIWFYHKENSKIRSLICLIGDGLFILYAVLEGVRWQMVPALAFLIGFTIVDLIRAFRKSKADATKPRKWLLVSGSVLLGLLFVGAVIFPTLLPVVDLPQPAGPYAVGSTQFALKMDDRPELLTDDPNDTREVLVDVWYPAGDVTDYPVQTYWDEAGITGKAYSQNSGMGGFWYAHLRFVKTNSHPGAPLTSDGGLLPVLIYSPAFYGLNTDNTMLMEDLASHGYVVFSIAHTYETVVSIFPDGEVIPGDLSTIFAQYDDHADLEEQYYQDFRSSQDQAEKADLVRQILTVDEQSNVLIDIRTDDILGLLDDLEVLNAGDPILAGRLNTDEIGVIGYSFGGASVLGAALEDDRVVAGVNVDGWPYGSTFAQSDSISQPTMLIRSDSNDEVEDMVSSLIYDKVDNAAYSLTVTDAQHENFWDFPLFFKVYKYIGFWGSVDAKTVLNIEDVAVVGFFDKYVKGEDLDLVSMLEGLTTVKDVRYKNVQ